MGATIESTSAGLPLLILGYFNLVCSAGVHLLVMFLILHTLSYEMQKANNMIQSSSSRIHAF